MHLSKPLLIEDDPRISGFECCNLCLIAPVSPSGLPPRLAGLWLCPFRNVDERLFTGVWIASSSWEGFQFGVVLKISICHQVMLRVWFSHSSHEAWEVVVELPLPHRSSSGLHTLGDPVGMNTGTMAQRHHDHFQLVS